MWPGRYESQQEAGRVGDRLSVCKIVNDTTQGQHKKFEENAMWVDFLQEMQETARERKCAKNHFKIHI